MSTGTIIEPKAAKAAAGDVASGHPSPTRILHKIVEVFSSLRLTVLFLCLAVLLVFIGTLAQSDEGLYAAQNRYFRSLLIWWTPAGAKWRLPVFPGGYLIGGVLLVNLLAAHAKRFKFTRKKIGIFIIHAGIILLILGQFATDLLSKEGAMRLFEGESRNYSEDFHANELAIIDKSNPEHDRVYAIPESRLEKGAEIRDARLPVGLRMKHHWENADLSLSNVVGSVSSTATTGALTNLSIVPRPRVTDPDSRNLPAAEIEVTDESGSLGTFLVYSGVTTRQHFVEKGKPYEISLRFARHYYPFSITLLKATHETYKGRPDIPKNFASRVRVENPSRQEARETAIYMNNPLRYAGLTFFQYQMAAGEVAAKEGIRPFSVLEVVHNPGWLTPYFSCVMVATGLIIQFMSHLIGFARKRRTTSP